jgi:K+-sensing histidine kinase KdpD
MTNSNVEGADRGPFASADFDEARAEALRRVPVVVRYGLPLVMVATMVVFGLGLERLVPPANLALIFVLPVVVAATTFGFGPALGAVAASVLAFDYFFTQPYYQFTIASPTDLGTAVLLLVIAAIVSAVASESRGRAMAAQRAARQAGALQELAHTVIEGRPRREVLQAAAAALGEIFEGPAGIFHERGGRVVLVASSGGPVTITSADEEAALYAIERQCPTRAGVYPFGESRLDLWPVRIPTAETLVLGVDPSKAANRRPIEPQRFIEVVGACLAADRRASRSVA